MTPSGTAGAGGNPFATRHVRPGRLVPRDADGTPLDIDALVRRARDLRAVAIEGPHGAGKTNLLAALAARLAADGLLAGIVRPASCGVVAHVLRARPGTTLCVDGWETLGPTRTILVRWMASRRRIGLVATSHRAVGLPTLVRCVTTPSLLARLVDDLPDHGGLIGPADIAQAFAAQRGDVREALYDLYDRFERRARGI